MEEIIRNEGKTNIGFDISHTEKGWGIIAVEISWLNTYLLD